LERALGEEAAVVIEPLLTQKNGFYAFDNALQVFSDVPTLSEESVLRWNLPDYWKHHYGPLAPVGVCFAQDVFGNQFIWNGEVYYFDAESGEVTWFAHCIEEWARRILDDPDTWAGRRTAQKWRAAAGEPVVRGYRLVPRIARAQHNDLRLDQLEMVRAAEAMRTRGERAVALYIGSARR